ncbi:MAG TPA: hypothetical protein VGT98_06050, partial [Candidatus Elarobacter sp.]|nr:hypothetical protein [Candidatus Elarobacter sp.]
MMRLRLAFGVVVAALAAPGMAHAAAQTLAHPHLYRPNPVFTSIQLDYIKFLPTPSGGVAVLPPLSEKATRAAVLDGERLAYRIRDDLGGFVPAPIGQLALSSGGHAVVGTTNGHAQIPLFQHHAGGKVNAFTFIGGGPPITPGNTDNGNKVVPGLGTVPAKVPPASNNNKVPPANGGFSGNGQTGGNKNGGSGTKTGGSGTGTHTGSGGNGAGAGTGTGGGGGGHTNPGKTGGGTTTTRRT